MPYPDQLLTDDERAVKHLHPHWITLVGPAFLLVVVALLGSFLVAVMPGGSLRNAGRLAVAGLAGLLLGWLVVIPFLSWRATHYVLTTHRVLLRNGILHHRGRDIALNRINDVSFEQTLWERVIGAGTLMVESAGESGQQVLKDIPHADRTQQLINRLIEDDHDRRAREAAQYEAHAGYEYESRVHTQPMDRLDG